MEGTQEDIAICFMKIFILFYLLNLYGDPFPLITIFVQAPKGFLTSGKANVALIPKRMQGIG